MRTRSRRRVERVVGRVARQPIVWLLPLAVLLLVSYVYPAIDVVRFSFTNATLLNPEYEYTLQSYTNVSANRVCRSSCRTPSSLSSPVCSSNSSSACCRTGTEPRREAQPAGRNLHPHRDPGVMDRAAFPRNRRAVFSEASWTNGVLRLMGLPTVHWLSDPVRDLVRRARQ